MVDEQVLTDYQKHREKRLATNKKYYDNNRERELEKNKKWRRRTKLVRSQVARKYAQTESGIYAITKNNAKYRGVGFEIEKEKFVEWLKNCPKTCEYCGAKLVLGSNRLEVGQSIDRKDNNELYTLENIVLSCRRCNRKKGGDISYETMVKIGRLLKEERERGSKRVVITEDVDAKYYVGVDICSRSIACSILTSSKSLVKTIFIKSTCRSWDTRLADLAIKLEDGDYFSPYSNIVFFIESPVYVQNLKVVAEIARVLGVFEGYLACRDLVYFEVPPKSWKKSVLSNGNADKDLIMRFAKQNWGNEIFNQDIADASCIALYGVLRGVEK